MTKSQPLFALPAETDRDFTAAPRPGPRTLRHVAASARARFAAQRRAVQLLEVSAGAVALAGAVFLGSLIASQETSQAGVERTGVDPEQLLLTVPRPLPAFEDTYQRYIGVLDPTP